MGEQGKRYVIVGNGVAANRAAQVLREGDPTGSVTLVSDESFPFYNRHLLPDYVVGKIREEDLVVYPPRFYKERKIKLRLGQKVVKCDPATNTLYLAHKEKLRYTTLLLCTGGRARMPAVYHEVADHFFTLKTLGDARMLRSRLAASRTVLFLGGDLISVRLGRVLMDAGKTVTFLLSGNAFWPLELTEERSREFADSLARGGANVIAGDTLERIDRENGPFRIRTGQGRELEADLVGAFFGLDPDVEFLHGSGIHVERGVLVDEHLRTNVANVYAAGDCAKIYNPAVKNYWVSVGWPNAERLGEVAAGNILGATIPGERAPESVFHFGDIVMNTSWWKEF